MATKINAALNGADYGHLADEVKKLEALGIDSFHIDIMDGVFIPDFAMSINDMSCVATHTKKPLDVHLMVEHPCERIEIFLNKLRKGDTVYIHPEAEYHPSTTLQKIIDAGMVPGIAINPCTSVETVVEMLAIVDKVLVVGGNKAKVSKLIALQDELDFEIYYEGYDRKIGADGFVVESDKLDEILSKNPIASEITINLEVTVEADVPEIV